MRILNLFNPPAPRAPVRLPAGCFTIDRTGRLLASTLPSSFPLAHIRNISKLALWSFESARHLGLPMNEFVVNYPAMRLTARRLGSGAIIFVAPERFLRTRHHSH